MPGAPDNNHCLKPFLATILLTLALGVSTLSAQEEFDPGQAIDGLEALDQEFGQADLTEEMIRLAQDDAEYTRVQAIACVEDIEPRVDNLNKELEILGDLSEEDDVGITEERVRVKEALSEASAQQSNCELAKARAEDILDRSAKLLSELSAERLWSRHQPIWEAARDAPARWAAWPGMIAAALAVRTHPAYSSSTLGWALLFGGLFGVGLGLFLSARFSRWFKASRADEGPPKLKFLFPLPLAKYAPIILFGLAVSGVVVAMAAKPSLDIPLLRVGLAVLAYGLGCVLIDWSTGPLSPSATIDGLVPDHVKPLRIRLRWLLIALILSFAVLGPGWLRESQHSDMLPETLLTVLVVIPLLALLLLAREIPGLKQRYGFIRLMAMMAILTVIVAEILGYRNFGNYMMHGIVRTALSMFALWMSLWLVDQAVAHISEGGTKSAYKMRTLLGLSPNPDEAKTAVGLYQLIADILLWTGFILFLIYVWDSTGNTLNKLSNFIVEGITIGEDTEIVPLDVIQAVLVFSGIIIATGWVKRWIKRRWLRHMTMDRGARDALITMVGYVGFLVAALVGLRIMGISLAGLAIVAAGVSVGIGFGLQAIANNFISGLILLFERPIKSGDFVTVGMVEGFVRRISIRSTEIETLDNQNVIVPNSELISGQVTNWVLHDPHGRLRLTVGVAYGSDVEKVKEILEDAANKHPQVITDGRVPGPKALFMGFGDSSLDFELRVRIKRIEKRFDVISDLNFEIDRVFRAHDIQIPFPQRDLHLRSWSEHAAMPPGGADSQTKSADAEELPEETPPDVEEDSQVKKIVGYRKPGRDA